MRISNWTAKRSGASITIIGVGDEGEDVKLTGVAEIKAATNDGEPATVAVDHKHVIHELIAG